MLISKQDLTEIFRAADLDSEQESIKSFLKSYEYPIDKSGKARYVFVEDLFQILKENKRAVHFGNLFYASLDEIREAFENILELFGEGLTFNQEEIDLINRQGMQYSTQEMINSKLLELNFRLITVALQDTEENVPYGGVVFRKDKFDMISNNDTAWFLVHSYKISESDFGEDFSRWLKYPDRIVSERTVAVTKKDIKKLIQAAEIDLAAEDVKTYLKLLENQADYKVNSRFIEFLPNLLDRHNRIVTIDYKFNETDTVEPFKRVLADFGAEFKLTEEEIQKCKEEHVIFESAFEIIKEKLSKHNLRALLLQGDDFHWIIFRKDKLSLIEDEILWSLLELDMWFN